ncbi:MAG: metal-dependent hydrolase [Verrucomicrobiales bacterium]|nr:hypothetical protein [Verrucomicrobiota bacterium JB025]
MNVFTHALLPVLATRALAGRTHGFGRWEWVGIGVAGALPDVLNPHLTLEARMTSWSHGLGCWLGLSVVVVAVCFLSRGKLSLRLAGVLSGAYLLHVFCDAISGGVNFLHPFGTWVWGGYWVHPVWWVPADVICLLSCYFMFRVIPNFRKLRERALPAADEG